MSDFEKLIGDRIKQEELREQKLALKRQRFIEANEEVLAKHKLYKRKSDAFWSEKLSSMNNLTMQSVDYLQEYGITPNNRVHLVTRDRKSGVFTKAKIFTKPMPAWILKKRNVSGSDGVGYQYSSWSFVVGNALGVDGNFYEFNTRRSKEKRLLTECPVADSNSAPHEIVSKMFSFMGKTLQEASNLPIGTKENTRSYIIPAWEFLMADFVAMQVYRSPIRE